MTTHFHPTMPKNHMYHINMFLISCKPSICICLIRKPFSLHAQNLTGTKFHFFMLKTQFHHKIPSLHMLSCYSAPHLTLPLPKCTDTSQSAHMHSCWHSHAKPTCFQDFIGSQEKQKSPMKPPKEEWRKTGIILGGATISLSAKKAQSLQKLICQWRCATPKEHMAYSKASFQSWELQSGTCHPTKDNFQDLGKESICQNIFEDVGIKGYFDLPTWGMNL